MSFQNQIELAAYIEMRSAHAAGSDGEEWVRNGLFGL
jgi:hypothetical protein